MQEGLTELNLQLSRKLFLLRGRPSGNSQCQVQLRLQRITLGLKLKLSSLLDQLLSWLASPSTRLTTKGHGQRGMTDYSASTFLRISFNQFTLTSIPISGDILQFQYLHSHSQAGYSPGIADSIARSPTPLSLSPLRSTPSLFQHRRLKDSRSAFSPYPLPSLLPSQKERLNSLVRK